MGIFKDIWDARPSKSIERARQFHELDVESIIPIPDFMHDKVVDCAICKVRFGKIFAKDSIPCLIITRLSIPFKHSNMYGDNTNAVICHKCVYHFGFDRYDPDL